MFRLFSVPASSNVDSSSFQIAVAPPFHTRLALPVASNVVKRTVTTSVQDVATVVPVFAAIKFKVKRHRVSASTRVVMA